MVKRRMCDWGRGHLGRVHRSRILSRYNAWVDHHMVNSICTGDDNVLGKMDNVLGSIQPLPIRLLYNLAPPSHQPILSSSIRPISEQTSAQ